MYVEILNDVVIGIHSERVGTPNTLLYVADINSVGIGYSYTTSNFIAPIIDMTPKSMGMREFRLLLLKNNILDSFADKLKQDTDSVKLLIEWEYATQITKENSLILKLKEYFSYDDNKIKQFFVDSLTV